MENNDVVIANKNLNKNIKSKVIYYILLIIFILVGFLCNMDFTYLEFEWRKWFEKFY